MGNEKTNREFIYRFSRELATVICVRSEVFGVCVQERPAPQSLQPLVRCREILPHIRQTDGPSHRIRAQQMNVLLDETSWVSMD
jgi:hypothetical protein